MHVSEHHADSALPRDVKIAVDYMRKNMGRRIRVADLLAATRTPKRTLHKHFVRFFGVAPLIFLRRLRLAAVRDALRGASHDTVTDIAMRFGFTHFGRFSSDYRRCFGELPSATRRRAVQSSQRPLSTPNVAVIAQSLVVVPFRTDGDRESNRLAGGLAEVLAAALARMPALCVRLAPAATSSTRRLGERYCLTGRLIRVPGRVRVVARLIDVATDRHLWGDSFDGAAGDELMLQDLLVRNVLCEIPPRILGEQIERVRRADLDVLTGAELTLRALPLALTSNCEPAADLLDQALRLAPDCGLAIALKGWCIAKTGILAWNRKAREDLAKGTGMADRAGILAPVDPMVLAIRASIAHLAAAYDTAEALAARAVAMDPTCAWGWDRLGWIYESTNRPDDAMPFFARLQRIPAPYLDGAASLDGVGTAHFCAGRYKEAEVALRMAALERPGSTGLHGKLAACYVQLGDKSAARAELAKLRTILPDISVGQYVASYPCRIASFADVMANSLAEIGMPA